MEIDYDYLRTGTAIGFRASHELCSNYLLLLLLVFAYIYISQGNVETHLPCGGIYNNHIIANCLQCVPVKEF